MKIFNKSVMILFLVIAPQLHSMNKKSEDALYTALSNKMLMSIDKCYNKVFYFSLQNQENPCNEMFESTNRTFEKLINNEIVGNHDSMFFDPRCNQPMEFTKQIGYWQERDIYYPQQCDYITLMVYNIPTIEVVNDEFITLLTNNIAHQKTVNKTNIVLNINATLHNNPKIEQLKNLLGSRSICGDIGNNSNKGHSLKSKIFISGGLTVWLGFWFFVLYIQT